jgi:hypothetical protein
LDVPFRSSAAEKEVVCLNVQGVASSGSDLCKWPDYFRAGPECGSKRGLGGRISTAEIPFHGATWAYHLTPGGVTPVTFIGESAPIRLNSITS